MKRFFCFCVGVLIAACGALADGQLLKDLDANGKTIYGGTISNMTIKGGPAGTTNAITPAGLVDISALLGGSDTLQTVVNRGNSATNEIVVVRMKDANDNGASGRNAMSGAINCGANGVSGNNAMNGAINCGGNGVSGDAAMLNAIGCNNNGVSGTYAMSYASNANYSAALGAYAGRSATGNKRVYIGAYTNDPTYALGGATNDNIFIDTDGKVYVGAGAGHTENPSAGGVLRGPWASEGTATQGLEIVNYQTATNIIATLGGATNIQRGATDSYDAGTRTLTYNTNGLGGSSGGITGLTSSASAAGVPAKVDASNWTIGTNLTGYVATNNARFLLTLTNAVVTGSGNVVTGLTASGGQVVGQLGVIASAVVDAYDVVCTGTVQTVGAGATATVNFDYKRYDADSVFDLTTDSLTHSSTGWCHVVATFEFVTISDGRAINLNLNKNGSAYKLGLLTIQGAAGGARASASYVYYNDAATNIYTVRITLSDIVTRTNNPSATVDRIVVTGYRYRNAGE